MPQSPSHPIRSRLAPTPSGYLHLGNALNFLLTWLLTRRAGGTLTLRIDDADRGRCRPEFIADIFHQLEWLGLEWEEGPTGPDDFTAHHSQLKRLERYRHFLELLRAKELLFACTCSRQDIRAASHNGLYPGTCRFRQQAPAVLHTWRISSSTDMGDFVLWRRDGLPAYQLASLVDDLDHRINLIVRGDDLFSSSAAQLYLAARLGPAGSAFSRVTFHHHPLCLATDGRKLAKSDQALSLAAMRQQGVEPAAIYRRAAAFLGLPQQDIGSLPELLQAFQSTPNDQESP